MAEKDIKLGQNHYLTVCHRLWHAMKRVLSYNDGVVNFATTSMRWPNLFKGVTVELLPCINPEPHRFSEIGKLNAEKGFSELNLDINDVNRTRDKWPGLDCELNKCGQDLLDNKRRVHAELQLWGHIKQLPNFVPFYPAKTHAHESLSEGRVVIGVSKPTCFLCHLFFQEAGAELLVIRSSSMNVYHRWALSQSLSAEGIPRMLYDKVDGELSRVLEGREIRRTETDTDSEPNSPTSPTSTDESAYDTSDQFSSEGSSDTGRDTPSIESEPDLRTTDI